MKNLVHNLDHIEDIEMNRQTITVKIPKPYTRKAIKPRQAHKLATRYTRKAKHSNREYL